MLNMDEDGRYKLSNAEWIAIKHLYGLVNSLMQNENVMYDRLHTIKNGWRDYRNILKTTEKMLKELMTTVPTKKLFAIEKELHNTTYSARMRHSVETTKDYVCVETQSYIDLLNKAVENDCFLCDKNEKQAKRCRLFRDIENTLPFSFPATQDGKCIMAGETQVPLTKD